jgi:ABC-type transport system substrate-binding protein
VNAERGFRLDLDGAGGCRDGAQEGVIAMTRHGNPHDPQPFRLSRRGFVGGAAVSAAAVAIGAAPVLRSARSVAAQDEGKSIIIGTLGEAQTINPFLTSETEGQWRVKMLFDEFVRANPATYLPEPGLAAEWSNDGLVFTFKLRPNATFSDGSEVTADDVAFTIAGYLAKSTASPRQDKFLSIAGAQEYVDGTADDVSGIKVVDPTTIEITLAKPDAPFLYNMRWVSVLPKAKLEGKSLSDDPFFQNPIGAGPYVFQSWDTGGDFVMTPNPHYWQASKPLLTGVTHRVIADANSLVLALQTGDIDASNYPAPTAKDQLTQSADLAVLVPPFTSPDGIYFNCTHEWLGKKEVRKAIAMAIDTKQFASDSLLGLGKPGIGPIAPDNWAFDKELQPIPYDVDGAKQLLARVGFPAGTKIRMMVNQGNVLREDWLTFTQQAVKAIGIEIVPEAIEWATLVNRVTVDHDFDAVGVPFVGVTAEPSELYDSLHTGASGNYQSYSNPDMDALLEQARQELDTEKAKGIYKQIQALYMDDVPMFSAWYRPFLHVVKKEFTGYTDSAAYGLFHTLEDWTVTA